VAIRAQFTDGPTGAVYANAHIVLDVPAANADTRQIVQRVRIYADAAAFAAGKAPVRSFTRTFGAAQYNAVRANYLAMAEPFLIANFFPGGTRVAD
jgi:hypothetical protein